MIKFFYFMPLTTTGCSSIVSDEKANEKLSESTEAVVENEQKKNQTAEEHLPSFIHQLSDELFTGFVSTISPSFDFVCNGYILQQEKKL